MNIRYNDKIFPVLYFVLTLLVLIAGVANIIYA